MRTTPATALALAALMAAAPGMAQESLRAPAPFAPDPWAAAPAEAAEARAGRDDAAPFQRDLSDLVAPPRRDRLFLSYGPRLIWGDPAERAYARESRRQPPRDALRLEGERGGVRY